MIIARILFLTIEFYTFSHHHIVRPLQNISFLSVSSDISYKIALTNNPVIIVRCVIARYIASKNLFKRLIAKKLTRLNKDRDISKIFCMLFRFSTSINGEKTIFRLKNLNIICIVCIHYRFVIRFIELTHTQLRSKIIKQITKPTLMLMIFNRQLSLFNKSIKAIRCDRPITRNKFKIINTNVTIDLAEHVCEPKINDHIALY